MSYETTLNEKDGAWKADAKIAAGVDDVDNTHPLNCTTDGTLEVELAGTQVPIDVIVDNVVPVTIPANSSVNLNQVGGTAITEGQKTMAASVPVVIALDQSTIPVSVIPGTNPFFFTYVSGTLSGIGSIVGIGVCTGIRVFANGIDSTFTINTGQTINLRSNQIFQIIPQENLTNPIIDLISGSIDVWMEVRGTVMPLPADLGLSLGIAHI